MSKHTPGPWATTGPRGEGFRRNYGIHHSSPGHDGGEFATVHTLHSTNQAQMTQDANARLIAAAPDLLAALQALTEWGCTYTSPLKPNSPHDLLIAAVNAIKKATTPE